MIPGLDLNDTSRAPLARLNSSGLPIHAGQVNKVWRGLVQVEGSLEPSVPVALKWMSGVHKLPVELACALAGTALGLPIPRGVAVLAQRDQLPGLPGNAKPLAGTDDYLCFGSVHQWPDDSTARLLGDSSADEFTWRSLCSGPTAAPGAAWDELAANADRHTGNLIYDGAKFWFIDHELALQPIAQVMNKFTRQTSRDLLLEHRARANKVAAELHRRHPADHGMLTQPQRFNRAETRLKLLADAIRTWQTGHSQVDTVWPLTEIVLRGIALRLPALALMLNQRLNVPDATSLWSSSRPSTKT